MVGGLVGKGKEFPLLLYGVIYICFGKKKKKLRPPMLYVSNLNMGKLLSG